jgi:hypothetical protein
MSPGNDLNTHPSLYISNIVATGLSVLGSIWMTCAYFNAPSPRTTALKLILGIAFADLFYSVANIISAIPKTEDVNTYCQVEGFLREFSAFMSIFLATSTAILCYKESHGRLNMNRSSKFFSQTRFLFKSFGICGIASLALAVAPFIFNKKLVYVKKTLFCWVGSAEPNPDVKTNFLILMIFEGIPLTVGLIITLFGYCKAISNTKQVLGSFLETVGVDVYKLLWYPAVLFIVFIPSLIDNAYQVFTKNPILGVEIAHILLTHSIGFLNAIVYGIQGKDLANDNNETAAAPLVPSRSRRESELSRSLTDDLRRASAIDFS